MSYTNDQYEGMGGSFVVDRKGNRQPAALPPQAGDEPAESAAQPQDKPDDAVVTASPDL